MKRTNLMLALLGLLVIMALVLSACGGGEATTEAPAEEPKAEEPMEEPEEPAEEDTGGAIVAEEATPTPAVMEEEASFKEAPMLAEMVAAG